MTFYTAASDFVSKQMNNNIIQTNQRERGREREKSQRANQTKQIQTYIYIYISCCCLSLSIFVLEIAVDDNCDDKALWNEVRLFRLHTKSL